MNTLNIRLVHKYIDTSSRLEQGLSQGKLTEDERNELREELEWLWYLLGEDEHNYIINLSKAKTNENK